MIILSTLLIVVPYCFDLFQVETLTNFRFFLTYFFFCCFLRHSLSSSPPARPLFIMVKTTRLKAAKSPKKVCSESSQARSKQTSCTRQKAVTEAQRSEASNDEAEEPASNTVRVPAHVVWDKYPERTERLLDFLDAHPDVAIKLFGDSTQVAKSEGHSKLTAKSNKGVAYLQVADGIFSIDENPAVRADFAANPTKYMKAVDNYITNT